MAENQYLQPFFEQLSQGTQVASQIRAAAQQQAQLDQANQQHKAEMALKTRQLDMQQGEHDRADKQQQFSNSLVVLKAGGQPLNAQGGTDQPVQLPTGSAPGATPGGTEMTSVPAPPGQTLSAGGQQFQVPTLDESSKAEIGRRIAMASSLDKEKLENEGVELPPEMAARWHMPAGTKILLDHATGLAKLDAEVHPKPVAPDKPKLGVHYEKDDKGNLSAFTEDPQSGEVKPAGRFPGVATTKDLGGGADGRRGRPE
jgi:hypothetical protein